MSSPRIFVVPTLMVTLWVATFGFGPRVSEAASVAPAPVAYTHLDATHLDATPTHQAAYVAELGDCVKVGSSDVDVDEDGADVVCAEYAGTPQACQPRDSIDEHHVSAYVRAQWPSLASTGPPVG